MFAYIDQHIQKMSEAQKNAVPSDRIHRTVNANIATHATLSIGASVFINSIMPSKQGVADQYGNSDTGICYLNVFGSKVDNDHSSMSVMKAFEYEPIREETLRDLCVLKNHVTFRLNITTKPYPRYLNIWLFIQQRTASGGAMDKRLACGRITLDELCSQWTKTVNAKVSLVDIEGTEQAMVDLDLHDVVTLFDHRVTPPASLLDTQVARSNAFCVEVIRASNGEDSLFTNTVYAPDAMLKCTSEKEAELRKELYKLRDMGYNVNTRTVWDSVSTPAGSVPLPVYMNVYKHVHAPASQIECYFLLALTIVSSYMGYSNWTLDMNNTKGNRANWKQLSHTQKCNIIGEMIKLCCHTMIYVPDTVRKPNSKYITNKAHVSGLTDAYNGSLKNQNRQMPRIVLKTRSTDQWTMPGTYPSIAHVAYDCEDGAELQLELAYLLKHSTFVSRELRRIQRYLRDYSLCFAIVELSKAGHKECYHALAMMVPTAYIVNQITRVKQQTPDSKPVEYKPTILLESTMYVEPAWCKDTVQAENISDLVDKPLGKMSMAEYKSVLEHVSEYSDAQQVYDTDTFTDLNKDTGNLWRSICQIRAPAVAAAVSGCYGNICSIVCNDLSFELLGAIADYCPGHHPDTIESVHFCPVNVLNKKESVSTFDVLLCKPIVGLAPCTVIYKEDSKNFEVFHANVPYSRAPIPYEFSKAFEKGKKKADTVQGDYKSSLTSLTIYAYRDFLQNEYSKAVLRPMAINPLNRIHYTRFVVRGCDYYENMHKGNADHRGNLENIIKEYAQKEHFDTYQIIHTPVEVNAYGTGSINTTYTERCIKALEECSKWKPEDNNALFCVREIPLIEDRDGYFVEIYVLHPPKNISQEEEEQMMKELEEDIAKCATENDIKIEEEDGSAP